MVMVAPTGTARFSGTRVPRREDARLVTGQGTFVDDVSLPGMLHACFVRSPFARARVAGIDTAEARALPGVHAVFVAADLNPGVHEQWHTAIGAQAPETPHPPLAEDEVRFVGDPVALVVASDRYVAEDASEVVVVDYEPLTPVVDYVAATESDEVVHAGYPGNVIGGMGGRPRTPSTPPSPPPPTWWRRPSASTPTPRCRWRPAGWWSTPRGRPAR
jgi:aerobic carbon-monoxide dehydrogenase large subunit